MNNGDHLNCNSLCSIRCKIGDIKIILTQFDLYGISYIMKFVGLSKCINNYDFYCGEKYKRIFNT